MDLNADLLKTMTFELLEEFKNIKLALILGIEQESKPFLAIGLSKTFLTDSSSLTASGMVKQVASLIEGGGGGQPNYATAGGKNLAGLDRAMLLAKENFVKS